jgi:adenylate kinase family enzyme
MSSPEPLCYRAALLLGPTGSGKTPLGDEIAARGLWGKRCLHFDFGDQLRRIVERNEPDAILSRDEIDFLRGVLDTGALLEDEHFPIAERILRALLVEKAADADTIVVLNGLPRHAGQAEAIERLLEVVLVVELTCTAETVAERIRTNVGGDRTGRVDDDLPAIAEKLRVYRQRTAPLVEYYRARGTRIEQITVSAASTPERLWRELADRA